jgi:antitoxin component YwqK of YwqJK toxin-antitoxin module
VTVTFSEVKEHFTNQGDVLCFDGHPFTGTISTSEKTHSRTSQYINGLRNGVQKIYYLNGQLKEASMYTAGLQNGRSITYHADGSKQLNANYADGELDGLYEEWAECGRLMCRKSFYKGRLVAINTMSTEY